jgi:hypothetical protein
MWVVKRKREKRRDHTIRLPLEVRLHPGPVERTVPPTPLVRTCWILYRPLYLFAIRIGPGLKYCTPYQT